MSDNAFLKGQSKLNLWGKDKKKADSDSGYGAKGKSSYKAKPKPKGRSTKGKRYQSKLQAPSSGSQVSTQPTLPVKPKKKP